VCDVVVRLRNGRDVVIRPIRPGDKGLLAAGMSRVSTESAYRRFLAPKRRLTPAELRYLTEIDFRDHVAFVAVAPDEPAELLGVARWVRIAADPGCAEFAFLVSDELQGQGLGTALADALVAAARERGITSFVATTLPHNLAAHRLLEHISADTRTTVAGGMHELRGPLAA
jgi:RimJ/RimL family protein N-acetyltransferase